MDTIELEGQITKLRNALESTLIAENLKPNMRKTLSMLEGRLADAKNDEATRLEAERQQREKEEADRLMTEEEEKRREAQRLAEEEEKKKLEIEVSAPPVEVTEEKPRKRTKKNNTPTPPSDSDEDPVPVPRKEPEPAQQVKKTSKRFPKPKFKIGDRVAVQGENGRPIYGRIIKDRHASTGSIIVDGVRSYAFKSEESGKRTFEEESELSKAPKAKVVKPTAPEIPTPSVSSDKNIRKEERISKLKELQEREVEKVKVRYENGEIDEHQALAELEQIKKKGYVQYSTKPEGSRPKEKHVDLFIESFKITVNLNLKQIKQQKISKEAAANKFIKACMFALEQYENVSLPAVFKAYKQKDDARSLKEFDNKAKRIVEQALDTLLGKVEHQNAA